MTRLTESITCIDCGAQRKVTKACANTVIRCKSCQKAYNREKARNRYRKLKGIPLDKTVTPITKKKKQSPQTQQAPAISQPEKSNLTPKEIKVEKKRKKKAIERLIEKFGVDDDTMSSSNDW